MSNEFCSFDISQGVTGIFPHRVVSMVIDCIRLVCKFFLPKNASALFSISLSIASFSRNVSRILSTICIAFAPVISLATRSRRIFVSTENFRVKLWHLTMLLRRNSEYSGVKARLIQPLIPA